MVVYDFQGTSALMDFLAQPLAVPKATSSTKDGVDDYAAADRRTATRRIRRVSGSSRLVLLLFCGLKAFAPTLWQYPMATSPTDNGVADYAAMDRRTATRTTCRVSGSSRLVLLFLCGLKLLHDAQRLRDPGQVVQRSKVLGRDQCTWEHPNGAGLADVAL